MNWTTIIGSVVTVASFAAFVGIVIWAFSPRRRRAFDDAARAPFALPEDADTVAPESRATTGPTAKS